MMFEELADGVRTINFKAIGGAAELLQQTKIMECSADKQKLDIEFFSCLPTKLICPEEDAVRVVEEQSRAELPEKSGGLASQLSIGDSILYALKLRRRCWYRGELSWAAETPAPPAQTDRRQVYSTCRLLQQRQLQQK